MIKPIHDYSNSCLNPLTNKRIWAKKDQTYFSSELIWEIKKNPFLSWEMETKIRSKSGLEVILLWTTGPSDVCQNFNRSARFLMLVLKQLPSLIVFRLEFSLFFLAVWRILFPKDLGIDKRQEFRSVEARWRAIVLLNEASQQRQRSILCSLRELLDGGWN